MQAADRIDVQALKLLVGKLPYLIALCIEFRDKVDLTDQCMAIGQPHSREGNIGDLYVEHDFTLGCVFPHSMFARVTHEIVAVLEFSYHAHIVVVARLVGLYL